MTRHLAAIASLLMCVPVPAAGAEGGVTSPDRAFDWTIGDWSGVRRDGTDGTEDPMTMRVEPILGGAGQIRMLEVTHDGGVYRGFAVQVFDRRDGVWRRQYANTTSGRFSPLNGTIDGERSIWRGAAPDRSRESRLICERPGPDRWLRTMSVSEDGGETWRVLWIDDLRRVAGAAAQGQSQPKTPPVRSP